MARYPTATRRPREAVLFWFVLLIVGALEAITARFDLLAGTVAEGVDPTAQSFGLSTVGWILVLAPFVVFLAGMAVGQARRKSETQDAVADFVS